MILFIPLYFYFSGWSNGSVSAFLLEFIGSFFLALIVWFASNTWQENIKAQIHEDLLINEFRLLKTILGNLFMRDDSDWNFGNMGPSFYFDNSRFNQLNDLLVQDRGRWEQFLLDYHDTFQKRDKLIDSLICFLKTMRASLIIGEKIDNEIRTKISLPKLAALKGSGFKSDREASNTEIDLFHRVSRGCMAGANDSEMLFGLANFTNEQLISSKIESIKKEFESDYTRTSLVSLKTTLKRKRKTLSLLIKAIRIRCKGF